MRLMMSSTLAWVVSEKSKNFVPVMAVKHWRRKFSVSMTSSPESGSGREGIVVGLRGNGPTVGWYLRGLRRAVMAWTLGEV